MLPVLFRVSILGREIPFHSYGFMLGLAFFLSVQMGMWAAAQDKIPTWKARNFGIFVIFAGYVIGHLHSVATDPGVTLWSGLGFTFYAAALGGALAGWPACKWLQLSYLEMADAAAPSVSLAHGIGRIGCFLYGCCYGIESPHGLCFAPGSAPFKDQVATGRLYETAAHSLPVIPTQLIESAYELLLTAVLVVLIKRRPRRGSVGLFYLAAYGPLRVVVEMFRADPGRGEILGLTTSTFIGLTTTAIALALLLVPPLVKLRPAREKAGLLPPNGGAPSPS
jgi:phosphatidylglycerol:prolipoprotein diacylglycerol transferase